MSPRLRLVKGGMGTKTATGNLEIPAGEVGMFSVYRNPETSEISGQELTLAGALTHEATPDAEISFNGLAYAVAVCLDSTEWVLTTAGKQRLAREHGWLLERWRK